MIGQNLPEGEILIVVDQSALLAQAPSNLSPPEEMVVLDDRGGNSITSRSTASNKGILVRPAIIQEATPSLHLQHQPVQNGVMAAAS
jgi:hypothetical protein